MRRARKLISKLRASTPAGIAAPKLHFELDYLDDVPTPPGAFSNHVAFKILERMLQPQQHLSIEDAGKKIVDMCLPTEISSYPAGSTGALETMLCALAQQILYDHPSHFKLVRLVTYLSTVTWMRKDQNEVFLFSFLSCQKRDTCMAWRH